MSEEKTSQPQGILLVDKPSGPSSFAVVAQVRKALGVRRVGHAGTLDPLASGLLVVLVGSYTRLSDLLTGCDKTYEACIAFGSSTQTDDTEGEVLHTADTSHLNEQMINKACQTFVGHIEQVPPAYSAIHVNGQRAYKCARKGQTVQIPPRQVRIDALQLLSWQPPHAHVRVRCSKGTYIRALARDLGQSVQVPAHLASLRRTHSGCYDLTHALCGSNLPQPAVLLQAMLQGPSAVPNLQQCAVNQRESNDLRCGRSIVCAEVPCNFSQAKDLPINTMPTPQHAQHLAVAHCNNALVALVRQQGNQLFPVRVF